MVTSRDLLKLVSRSFALCIPLLDSNKKDKVENQYLLARFLDTIEDSNANLQDKIELTEKFTNILETENLSSLENLKQSISSHSISDNDKILIENSEIVFKTFFTFDKKIKTMSINYLKEMGDGMMKYQTAKVETFEMLDDYCYYVAGTVGLYLTELVALVDNIELNKDDAISFGRFLQKINILKDSRGDLEEGRFFLPLSIFENSKPKAYYSDDGYKQKSLEVLTIAIEDVKKEIEPTFRYIKSIGKVSKGYRVFTIISSVMACETLKLMENNYNIFVGSPIKIKKSQLFNILFKAKLGYYTNSVIDKYLKTIL